MDAANRGTLRLETLVHGHYPGKPLPKGVLPGVKTIGFWDIGGPQNWGLPWHRNEGIEITFLESGRLAYGIEGREYELRPDDLTLTRPWQCHHVGNPNVGPGRLHWLIVDVGVRRPHQAWRWPSWILLSKPDLDEITDVLRHNEQPVWKTSPDLRRCFQAIGHAVESDRDGGSVSRLTLRLNEILILLLDLFRRQKVALNKSLSSSQRTVELFLADLCSGPERLAFEWSVGKMADACGLGLTQFIHHVRVLTNMTPMQYLSHCRLDLAANLLRKQPEESVTAVSLKCGFSSSQYFATAFNRRFGCTPREIRPPQPRS